MEPEEQETSFRDRLCVLKLDLGLLYEVLSDPNPLRSYRLRNALTGEPLASENRCLRGQVDVLRNQLELVLEGPDEEPIPAGGVPPNKWSSMDRLDLDYADLDDLRRIFAHPTHGPSLRLWAEGLARDLALLKEQEAAQDVVP